MQFNLKNYPNFNSLQNKKPEQKTQQTILNKKINLPLSLSKIINELNICLLQ